MKKVHQGHNGCVLATLAMLANVSYEEAEQRAGIAITEAGLGWRENWWSTFGYASYSDTKKIAIIVARELGLSGFIPVPKVVNVKSTGSVPNLKGKGQISVELPYSGHSMAYENGLIYDPDFDSFVGETWEQYTARRGSNNILRIVVTPLENS